jgi:dTDP-4-dehydrorhamnose 3,5-epimerase
MLVEKSPIFPEILLITPKIYKDNRGSFFESFNQEIQNLLGVSFLQENHSISKKNVIRGLHYQWDLPTGKLCRAIKGSLIDYVVDIRRDSPTFGKYDSFLLTEENQYQVWIPPGFAHGFLSLEDDTHLLYKCTAIYNKDGESGINPFDETINIDFFKYLSKDQAIMSDKDLNAQSLAEYIQNPKF